MVSRRLHQCIYVGIPFALPVDFVLTECNLLQLIFTPTLVSPTTDVIVSDPPMQVREKESGSCARVGRSVVGAFFALEALGLWRLLRGLEGVLNGCAGAANVKGVATGSAVTCRLGLRLGGFVVLLMLGCSVNIRLYRVGTLVRILGPLSLLRLILFAPSAITVDVDIKVILFGGHNGRVDCDLID